MEVESFSIKSNASDRELVFLAARKDHFIVELNGIDVRATVKVYAYSPHMSGIAELFCQLAAQSLPWSDAISWESLEREFSISAACSSLGVISFQVRILHLGRSEEWSLVATLTTELGQLPELAAAAARFFYVVVGD